MKKKTVILSMGQNRLMWEALRRIVCFNDEDVNTNLAGLGTPYTYKTGVECGLFTVAFREKETPRVGNWYKLTPIGVKIAKQMIRKGIGPKSCHEITGQLPCRITIMV